MVPRPFLLNGAWVSSAAAFEVRAPWDGQVLETVCRPDPGQVGQAVAAAHAAFPELKALPTHARADLLGRMAEGVAERAEPLARTLAQEAGKPLKDARGEVGRAVGTLRWAAEEARRWGGEWFPLDTTSNPALAGRSALVRRFPVGPVLAITPFNFPLNLACHKIAPALAVGCPVIHKPASQTPLTALALAGIAVEAGAPPGALQTLPMTAAETERLLADDRISALSFTGSPAVGWALRAKAGTKRVSLELGGNAAVILEEAEDIGSVARRCATGAFAYAGQVCISVQRIYVRRALHDGFLARFVEAAKALQVGDPLAEGTDVGPMISAEARSRTAAWVEEAKRAGAEILCGGRAEGPCYLPTVLAKAKPGCKAYDEEAFAPLALVEPYDDLEAAFRAVNASRFGLQAGIYARDWRTIARAHEALEVGGVIVNDVPSFRADPMPYGGAKASGLGREGLRYAMEELTERRVLVLDR
jgi:glyceraldehyde-3-phosphate dehydrogenase (NADP+)